MASILDKYGIKEVADVTFYKIKDDGTRGVPVLYLDTLKISTIEQTAENVEAKGGKGNPALVSWDFGKEINVTLEDALFSAKSMAMMFSGLERTTPIDTTTMSMHRTIHWLALTDSVGISSVKINNNTYTNLSNVNYYLDGNGVALTTTADIRKGNTYLVEFDLPIKDGHIIEINQNDFPGSYYITGDTYIRSQITQEDEFFQFVIPKAKVQATNTITLQADGEPTTFNMSLRVLRADNMPMMQLIKYDLAGGLFTTLRSKTMANKKTIADLPDIKTFDSVDEPDLIVPEEPELMLEVEKEATAVAQPLPEAAVKVAEATNSMVQPEIENLFDFNRQTVKF